MLLLLKPFVILCRCFLFVWISVLPYVFMFYMGYFSIIVCLVIAAALLGMEAIRCGINLLGDALSVAREDLSQLCVFHLRACKQHSFTFLAQFGD